MCLLSEELILAELERLRKKLAEIEKQQEDNTLKHDEQSFLDQEWTKYDTLIYHLTEFYNQLTGRHTYNETEYYSAEEDTSVGYTGGDSNFNDGDY
jgi:ribosome-binding ATPase YchF (GTP1/OBG family)